MGKSTSMDLIEQAIQILPETGPLAKAVGRKDEHNRWLAQYYDTRGWLKYRQSYARKDPNLLEEAITDIKEALVFDQRSSIIHYHLARLFTARLDQKWAHLSLAEKQDVEGHTVNELSDNLRNARKYWAIASDLDTKGRMGSKLARIKYRLDKFQDTFDNLNFNYPFHIKGED